MSGKKPLECFNLVKTLSPQTVRYHMSKEELLASARLLVTPSAETFREIYPFYNWMIVNQPAFTTLSDSAVTTGSAVTGH